MRVLGVVVLEAAVSHSVPPCLKSKASVSGYSRGPRSEVAGAQRPPGEGVRGGPRLCREAGRGARGASPVEGDRVAWTEGDSGRASATHRRSAGSLTLLPPRAPLGLPPPKPGWSGRSQVTGAHWLCPSHSFRGPRAGRGCSRLGGQVAESQPGGCRAGSPLPLSGRDQASDPEENR